MMAIESWPVICPFPSNYYKRLNDDTKVHCPDLSSIPNVQSNLELSEIGLTAKDKLAHQN